MFGLQEGFDREINAAFVLDKLGLLLIECRLEEMGLCLSWWQRRRLRKQLQNSQGNTLEFSFTKKQIKNSKFASEEQFQEAFDGFMDKVSADLEELQNGLEGVLAESIEKTTDYISEKITKDLLKKLQIHSRRQRKMQRSFSKSIYNSWRRPIMLLEVMVTISDEAAAAHFDRSDEYIQNDALSEALTRIHAKASTVVKEILLLMMNGFPDGAQARWRTLHELAVTSMFLWEHGNKAAIRYLDHHDVGVFKAAKTYNSHHQKLGLEPIPDAEFAELKQHHRALVEKYGEEFDHDYGWAKPFLNCKRPNFADIEAAVEMDYNRPNYRDASSDIHASSLGVFSRLGLFPDEEIILLGPSATGLAQPAINTINSYLLVCNSLFTYGANVDSLVTCKVLQRFASEARNAFAELSAVGSSDDLSK